MADQGRWFKLWCSALSDDDLSNLDISDFGRWAKLGAHVKEHGTSGVLRIAAPAKHLCSILQLASYSDLIITLNKLPNIEICDDKQSVTCTVTFCNWHKYQIDGSAERMRRLRRNVTTKKRGEEKRGEEKRITPIPPVGDSEFSQFWNAYPKKQSKGDAEKAWKQTSKERPPLSAILSALDSQRASEQWTKDGGQFIPLPAGWLRKHRWDDVVEVSDNGKKYADPEGARKILDMVARFKDEPA